MCLLAAEMMAVEQSSPDELYTRLTERLGAPAYQRLDAPADDNVRAKLAALTPESVKLSKLWLARLSPVCLLARPAMMRP